MANLCIFFTVLLIVGLAFAQDSPPESSSAPSPADLGSDAADSPGVQAPVPEIRSPPSPVSPSPAESPVEYSSPPMPETESSPSPAPSNSPPMPESPPSPSPSSSSSPAPAPEPSEADMKHDAIAGSDRDNGEKSSGGGGMSGGKKAGIFVGVFAAVCVVGLAGFVYKKRQDNIRRSRYGYAARELL